MVKTTRADIGSIGNIPIFEIAKTLMNSTKDLNLSGSKAEQNDMEQIQKTENNMKTLHEKKQETYEKRKRKQNLSTKICLREATNPTNPTNPTNLNPKKATLPPSCWRLSQIQVAKNPHLQSFCSNGLPHFPTIFARCSQPVFVETTSKGSFDHHKFS